MKGATRSSIVVADRLAAWPAASCATGPGRPWRPWRWKRSTKACRWARSASCLLGAGACRRGLLGRGASRSRRSRRCRGRACRSARCRMQSTELFSSSRSWLMMIGGVRVLLQARLQPQGAFQVEIVGRFVEQQQVGLGEQGRGQGHPHAPAAGELGHRPGQVVAGEAQARPGFRRRARARRRRRSRSAGRRSRPCSSGSAVSRLGIRPVALDRRPPARCRAG